MPAGGWRPRVPGCLSCSVLGASAHAPPPGRGALRPWLPTSDLPLRAMPASKGEQVGTAPPTCPLVLSDPCVPGPEQGAGTTGPDVGLPLGGPLLGVGQKSRSRPCGQSISVLISQALGGAGPKMGHLGPGLGGGGVSGTACQGPAGGGCPSQRLPPCPAGALLLACPRLPGHLNPRPAPLPEPSALIYVLLRWGIFSKNRTDVRKAAPPGNHA